nr:MAG TPA: hypothetical protein [Caudoviricetes sp.]
MQRFIIFTHLKITPYIIFDILLSIHIFCE